MQFLVYAALIALVLVLLWEIRAIRSKLSSLSQAELATVSTEDLESLLELEVQRARRLNYPLSVIVLRREKARPSNHSSGEVLKLIAADPRYVGPTESKAGVINIFRNSHDPAVRLRSTDMAVYDKQGNRFAILLVGTERKDAENIAKRIAASLSEKLSQIFEYRCSEFPGDHYFMEDLLTDSDFQRHTDEQPEASQAALS